MEQSGLTAKLSGERRLPSPGQAWPLCLYLGYAKDGAGAGVLKVLASEAGPSAECGALAQAHPPRLADPGGGTGFAGGGRG